MRLRNKVLVGIIAIFSIIVSGCLLLACNKTNETDNAKVKVGVILPLTGDLAFVGTFIKNSFIMANADNVEFIFEDCMGNPKNAISAAKKLIDQDKVHTVASGLSFISESINPYCENNNIEHITFSFSPSLTEKNNVIRPFVSSSDEAKMIVQYIENNKYSKVAFLRHIEPDAEYAFNNIIRPSLAQSKIEIVDVPFYNQNVKDFKSELLKIKDAGVELIVLQSFAFNIPNAMKSYKEYELSVPMLGDLNFLDIHDDLTKEYVDGIPFIGLKYVLSDRYKSYANQYVERFDVEPFAFGAYAFDIASVLNHTKSNKKNEFINEVNEAKIEGVTGNIVFDQTGDQKNEYCILQFKNKAIAHVN